ncbi:MAG: hypothetical protein HYX68_20750 [Planctomycetes bacterium]|nr:hypothetical protein [Planctomycetota bacterium]
MELAFDERNLLIPCVHDVTLEGVKEKFGSFQKSDRRPTLFAKLVEYLDAVKRAGIGASVIVDGSFVMGGVDEPGDIDLLLVLPPDWDDAAELNPYQYNVVSGSSVRKTHGFDILVVKSGSIREKELSDYFQKVRPKWCQKFGWPADTRKGILKVTP